MRTFATTGSGLFLLCLQQACIIGYIATAPAPGRLLITAAMRAPGMRARTMASMLLPRPEMRMTMDFMGCWNDEKILAEDRAWARGPAGARPGAWPR